MNKPMGDLDPNSQHQIWSRWRFIVKPGTKCPAVVEVIENAQKYFLALFRSQNGRLRCDYQDGQYALVIEVEGPPVHDPALRAYVEQDFAQRFMATGFGVGARLVAFEAGLLAGDVQDGKPPAQFLVVPNVIPTTRTFM